MNVFMIVFKNSVINRFHGKALKFISFSLFYILYYFPLKEVKRPLQALNTNLTKLTLMSL